MHEVNDFLSVLSRIQIKGFINAEKLLKKISKFESAIKLDRVCLKALYVNESYQKYTDFCLRNPRTRVANFIMRFDITLLETEMKDRSIHLENLSSELVVCQNNCI